MNIQIYVRVLEIIFIFMCVVFVLAQILKNNSIVDVFWGLGFVMVVFYFLVTGKQYIPGQFIFLSKHLVNICVIIWGLRLATHIRIRNAGKGEDWRYVNFRRKWDRHPLIGAFFQVFMLQGVFMFILALPIIHVNLSFLAVNYLTYVGLIIWLTGFFFEAVGDYQLLQFKKDPKNKQPMKLGLWKYTRHPNYFGEILMWWGIWIMTINFFAPLQTLISLLSPFTITWLLTRVSGVPMLEKKYKDNEEYKEYIKVTPALFPRFW